LRVSNERGGAEQGPWSELLKLQSEFQSRLADETLRYLRRLQGALGPAVPGTVVVPDGSAELHAEGHPGGRVELALDIENRQRVHCMTSPMLSPLVGRDGATWFPEVELAPPSLLVAPGEVGALVVAIRLPAELPPDIYHGTLLLHGFKEGGLRVSVSVLEPEAPSTGAGAEGAEATASGPTRAATRRRRTAGRRRRTTASADGP
jgi:hypothetical protein